MNSNKKKDSDKDTDFLAFVDFHPLPKPPVDDITGKTDAERKGLVKNV